MTNKTTNTTTGRIERRVVCHSCDLLRINGVICHEIGCPDAWRDVKRECIWCGSDFVPEDRDQSLCDTSCLESILRCLVASCGKLFGSCPRKRPNSYPSTRLSVSTNSRHLQAPDDSLFLSVIILAEVTWTLRSHFAVPREKICAAIQQVLALPSVSVDPVAFDAVARFVKNNVDFTDCALAAASSATGLPLVTYDQDYRKFPDVTAHRPSETLAYLDESEEP